MVISNDSQYREYKNAMENILAKGTALGNMEFLPQSDKDEFIRITDAIYEWEAAYHPLPGETSTLSTDSTKKDVRSIHTRAVL